MILASNYNDIDFNELYKRQRKNCSFEPKTQDDWDKKAIKFGQTALNSSYADDFLNLVDFAGVSSVLDFACGAGAISLKVCKRVKNVFAYDYSPKMIEFLNSHIDNLAINNIKTAQKAFEDDWSDVCECDLVFASRCLEVDDPKFVLEKLLSKTKKRLYLTYKVESSFVDDEILDVISREIVPKPNYMYILNIIAQMGYEASVSFINAGVCANVSNQDEFIKQIAWQLGTDLSESEKQRLIDYYKNGGKAHLKPTKWAFMAISKD